MALFVLFLFERLMERPEQWSAERSAKGAFLLFWGCANSAERFPSFSLRLFRCDFFPRPRADELPACNEEVQIEENGPPHPCGAKAIAAREHLQQQGDATKNRWQIFERRKQRLYEGSGVD